MGLRVCNKQIQYVGTETPFGKCVNLQGVNCSELPVDMSSHLNLTDVLFLTCPISRTFKGFHPLAKRAPPGNGPQNEPSTPHAPHPPPPTPPPPTHTHTPYWGLGGQSNSAQGLASYCAQSCALWVEAAAPRRQFGERAW